MPESSALDLIEKLGPFVLTIISVIVGYVKLGGKVDRLEEKIADHQDDDEKSHKLQESRVERVERDLSLRISQVEVNHEKLTDILFKEVRSLTEAVNGVQSTVKEIQGYIKAREEFENRLRSRRSR